MSHEDNLITSTMKFKVEHANKLMETAKEKYSDSNFFPEDIDTIQDVFNSMSLSIKKKGDHYHIDEGEYFVCYIDEFLSIIAPFLEDGYLQYYCEDEGKECAYVIKNGKLFEGTPPTTKIEDFKLKACRHTQ